MAVTDTDGIYLWGTPPVTNLHDLALRGVLLSDSEDSDIELQSPNVSGKKQTQSAMIHEHGDFRLSALYKSQSDPDIHIAYNGPKSSGSKGRLRKTASDRNAGFDSNDVRLNPIEISLTDAARRASASGHPGLNHIKRLISCDQSLLIQVSTTAPQKKKRKQTGRNMQ